MRSAVRPVLVTLAVLAVLMAVVWLGQRRMIYFPDRSTPPPPGGVRAVALETADGLRLTAWLVPPAGADRRLAVLVAPGNAGNREHRLALAEPLAAAGLTVLLLDYRGYGGNPGRPSEAGLRQDARAGLAHLTAAGFTPDRIVYFGESLGAGVVGELATEHPPGGLVLRSPFVSLTAVGTHHYPLLPVGALLRDRYELAQHVERVDRPTTVILGTADSVVPAEQSRTVADRAAGDVTLITVDGADHNDPALTHGRPVVDAVLAVADRLDRS
jgi:fermentation-respiration switch protein FrsA (DUF1100 family)